LWALFGKRPPLPLKKSISKHSYFLYHINHFLMTLII
jgi:hypothetical protein